MNNVVFDIGTSIEIRHKKRICCKGKIVSIKRNPAYCVSVDGKYFFNLFNIDLVCKVLENQNESENFIDLSGLKIMPWNFCRHVSSSNKNIYESIEVFRDFDCYEIDEEVKPICLSLNKIPGIRTVSSCSGHYIIPPYIIFSCDSLETLNCLSKVISSNFSMPLVKIEAVLVLKHFVNSLENEEKTYFKLTTDNIGEKAWQYLLLVSEIIERDF